MTADPSWRATAVGGGAMVVALVLALAQDRLAVAAIALALAGATVAVFVLAAPVVDAVRRQPALLALAGVVVVAALWFLTATTWLPVDRGASLSRAAGDVARARLWPLLLMTLTATGGVVLIADALRVRLRRHSPWRELTGDGAPIAPPFPWRAVVGVLLVAWAAFFGIGIAGPYISHDPGRMFIVLLIAAGGIAVTIGTPLLIAAVARGEQSDAARARDAERSRFAAHLHDSVLQTLALVQRQAHDPASVARLARRQEHALRAWMAGEAELASETLVAALRDVVAAVEDEHGVAIELSAIGDRALDEGGEALVAATREALRNAVAHGAGAPVFVFAEVSAGRAEVFVRDEGPGFAKADVPAERRGIRDAIEGRMAAAGGSAVVESVPGEGTEVALRLGARA
ncbi:MAG TPA: hypothetical protein VNT55_20020 [Baekduia sp.]|nr:hypothetical protein [Baekduia sp.]